GQVGAAVARLGRRDVTRELGHAAARRQAPGLADGRSSVGCHNGSRYVIVLEFNLSGIDFSTWTPSEHVSCCSLSASSAPRAAACPTRRPPPRTASHRWLPGR